jgi:hypothetical protein
MLEGDDDERNEDDARAEEHERTNAHVAVRPLVEATLRFFNVEAG